MLQIQTNLNHFYCLWLAPLKSKKIPSLENRKDKLLYQVQLFQEKPNQMDWFSSK